MDEKKDITKVPDVQTSDIAHTAARVVTSLVPGGTELLNAIIAPPIQKRRDEWIQSIAECLVRLEEKVEGFRIEDLSENETFVTTVLHASQVAIRNHQKEKLEALRNAVLNSALPDSPDDNIQSIYLNLIDVFTPLHLRLLSFFDSPRDYLRNMGIEMPDSGRGSLLEWGKKALPEIAEQEDLVRKISEDLKNQGLIEQVSFPVVMTMNGLFGSRTTDIGKDFLRFITNKDL